jgi:hypothetical protein
VQLAEQFQSDSLCCSSVASQLPADQLRRQTLVASDVASPGSDVRGFCDGDVGQQGGLARDSPQGEESTVAMLLSIPAL